MSSASLCSSNTRAARARTTGSLSADSSPERFRAAPFGDAATSARVAPRQITDPVQPTCQPDPPQPVRGVDTVQQPARMVDAVGDAVAHVLVDQSHDAAAYRGRSAARVTARMGDPDVPLLIERVISAVACRIVRVIPRTTLAAAASPVPGLSSTAQRTVQMPVPPKRDGSRCRSRTGFPQVHGYTCPGTGNGWTTVLSASTRYRPT